MAKTLKQNGLVGKVRMLGQLVGTKGRATRSGSRLP